MPYRLSAVAPLFMQVESQEKGGERRTFLYYGFEPVRRDPDGRITVVDAWPVMCRPPTPEGAPKAPLVAGFAPLDGGDGCTTHDRAVLDAGVKANRSWAEPPDGRFSARWLRDP